MKFKKLIEEENNNKNMRITFKDFTTLIESYTIINRPLVSENDFDKLPIDLLFAKVFHQAQILANGNSFTTLNSVKELSKNYTTEEKAIVNDFIKYVNEVIDQENMMIREGILKESKFI